MAMLAGADESLSDVAFQYGRNVGLAFQLVDDLLDFVSSSAAMGKPTAADLKLGLATAPVLFACERVRKLTAEPIPFQAATQIISLKGLRVT
jgi:decaprenyl-diphosphate synthase subunit 1